MRNKSGQMAGLLAVLFMVALLGPCTSRIAAQANQEPVLTFETTGKDQVTLTVEGLTGACRLTWLEEGETFTQDILDNRGWGEGDCAANYSPELRPSEWRTPGFLGSRPGYLGYNIPERLFLAIRSVDGQWGDAGLIEVTQQVLLHDAFGRATDEALLRTNPNGSKVTELFAGQEFKVFRLQDGWYQVVTGLGDAGWLPAELTELAVEGDEAVRRYADGFCYSTPAMARRNTDAGSLSRWQHELLFADNVELPGDGEEALVFQGSAIRVERQYRVAETDPVLIELNAFWVARHPSEPKINLVGWRHPAAWQLIYECGQ